MIIVEKKSRGFHDILLGRCGENNILQIRINIQSLIDTYGDGNAVLVHKRSEDSIPYLVPIERDGNEIVWTVTSVDTNYPGVGECEIRWLVGDAIAKSIIYKTVVRPSLTGETTPEPPDSWYDLMIAYLNEHTVTDVAVNYLPSGSEPTVEYDDGLVTFGIPAGEKGEKGDKGDKGDTGAKGDKGDKGDTGAQGIPGIQGEKGEPGTQGEKGEKGDKGDTGATGAKGEKGDKGDKGDQGEQGIQGIQGLKGDKGDKGDTGEQGPKGDKGETGATGATGPKGDKGDQGIQGIQGEKGDKGDKGEQGIQGEKGDKGDPGEVSEAELTAKLMDKADVIIATASGAIASFPDGAAVAAKNVTIGIEPVQSGSGDPSPDNVRPISGWTGAKVTKAGKNLIPVSRFSDTSLFTINEDGSITQLHNDTTSESAMSTINLKAGTYTISRSMAMGRMAVYAYIDGQWIDFVNGTNASYTFTTNKEIDAYVKFSVNGSSYPWTAFVQIETGSTATEFAPFDVSTYPITFPTEAGTVYGGTLDVTTGLLTVDRAMVDLGTLEWRLENNQSYPGIFYTNLQDKKDGSMIFGICSCYPFTTGSPNGFPMDKTFNFLSYHNTKNLYIHDSSYSDAASFKAAMSGVQLVYELATPQTYQLTPTEVEMLLGENNVWADTGDTTVTYRADTKRYIDGKIAEAIANALNA